MVRRIDDSRQDDLALIEIPRTFHSPAGWHPCDVLPELSGIVALDLETKDPGIGEGTGSCWPHRERGFVCGIAIKWAGGKFYLPLRHAAGNTILADDAVWQWLRQQAAKPSVVFVMAHAVYDTGWLLRHDIVPVNAPRDVQVMAFLLDEHRKSYSLASLSKDFLYRDKGTLTLVDMARSLHIKHPMSNMDKLPAWIVEPYALDDVDLTYELYWHFLPQIADQGLEDALALESECTLVSVDMRWTGVRIDQRRLELTGAGFALKCERAINQITDLTGIAISPFDNAEAMKALREENSEVKFGITETGRDSVDRFALQAIGSPVAKLILNARRYEKARGTFVESLGKYIHDGRIHAEFHSTRNNSSNDDDVFGNDSMFGATSGRWACVAGWTSVTTRRGVIAMENVRVGDEVWTHRNRWRPVTATYIKGREPMLDVRLYDGNILTCTSKHRLLLATGEWIEAGELHERFKDVGHRHDQHPGGSVAVPQPGRTDDGRDSDQAGHDISQRAAHRENALLVERAQGTGDVALLELEARRQEPDEGQDWRGASELEGRVVGPQRIHDNAATGWRAGIRSSKGHDEDSWNAASAGGLGRASHRQQRGEQSPGQSRSCLTHGAQAYPRLAASGNQTVEIAWIEAGGSHEVFDITVEEDESYLASGCLSHNSSNPNLQNIPARDAEIGPAVRSCFIPEDGQQWLKLDYASQEPRLTVHFASLAKIRGRPLRGAAEMVERFRQNPMTDLHGECAALMGVSRSHAKTINLALTYGQQGAALCRSLGLPVGNKTLDNGSVIEVAGKEGQRLLDRHFEAVPFIRQLFDLAKWTARNRGYVKTLSGRRIRFEKYPDGNYARIYKALNGVIQGSAADQMKMACVALRREGLLPNLIVHDEADRSIPPGTEGDDMIRRMAEIMEDVVQVSVPMVAEAKTGPSWGEL